MRKKKKRKGGGLEIVVVELVRHCGRRRCRRNGLIFTQIINNSKYKAMKIVLNAAIPSVTLRLQPINDNKTNLPPIDAGTGNPTLTVGSLNLKFDGPGVSAVSDAVDEFLITFTKDTSLTVPASVNVVGTAANENGDTLISDVLTIDVNPAESGVATGLVWANPATAPAAVALPKVMRH